MCSSDLPTRCTSVPPSRPYWARTLSKAVTAVLMYNESAASVLIPKLLPLNCSGVIHLHPGDPFQCASELARYDPSGSYHIQVI